MHFLFLVYRQHCIFFSYNIWKSNNSFVSLFLLSLFPFRPCFLSCTEGACIRAERAEGWDGVGGGGVFSLAQAAKTCHIHINSTSVFSSPLLHDLCTLRASCCLTIYIYIFFFVCQAAHADRLDSSTGGRRFNSMALILRASLEQLATNLGRHTVKWDLIIYKIFGFP
jgi:hypothetical protein